MSPTEAPRVAVIGGGGHAKVIVSTLQACGLSVTAILDEDRTKLGKMILGAEIFGDPETYFTKHQDGSIIGVGGNQGRRTIAARFPQVKWVTAVHPSAYVHPSAQLGPGTVIFAGAVIQPEARLGAHVIVNTGATVDHDCVVGDYAHLAPGTHLAGEVHVGEGALLGIGSVVKPGISVGPWTIVGAGAVVVSDVGGHLTVVGVPARSK